MQQKVDVLVSMTQTYLRFKGQWEDVTIGQIARTTERIYDHFFADEDDSDEEVTFGRDTGTIDEAIAELVQRTGMWKLVHE